MYTNKICTLHYKNNTILQKLNTSMSVGFSAFVESYQLKLSTIKLKIIENLKNGDFTWFRPIYDTNITRLMLDMNKELYIVMDNPNYKRESSLKINDKMYKLYTFQVILLNID